MQFPGEAPGASPAFATFAVQMKKILVTGGCGYIGSHTIVDLLEHGYDVISADNNSRSDPEVLPGIEKITGQKIKNYRVDLCDLPAAKQIFQENNDIHGIIHFAAYKAVGESTEEPLMYFQNNLGSLINILQCARDNNVPHFVFSSSCTVYGTPDALPVTETTAFKPAESPYGSTKQIGEEIVTQTVNHCLGLNASLLRYFNPAGAHPSSNIGELPIGKPQNLVPAITQTAIGKITELKVWGDDYQTRDGSCIRDFIHVCDIAHAHTLALQRLSSREEKIGIYNLGSGTGYSVLELIHAFEKSSGTKLNYSIAERRAGDVAAIYANNEKAKHELQWQPKYNINDIMQTAWAWEKKLNCNSK